MRTFFWFTSFGLYMIYTAGKYLRLIWIKRKGFKARASEYAYNCVKKWASFVIRTVGAEIEVDGRENLPDGTCLFVANHQGYLDIPVFLSMIDKPLGFVAKKELSKAPILSEWMREIHCIFMDRENIREAVKSINEGIGYLKSGYSMVIFPEGTRARGGKIGEFKKGSMKFAVKAEVPIVPVAINGTYKAFEEFGRIRRCKVKVSIGNPIYISNLSKEEQNNLATITKDIIEKKLPC